MKYRFAAFDTETDPFQYGRVPQPFCAGLYDGAAFNYWWGKDCIAQFLKHIQDMPPTIFFAHNGGKFDYHFIIDHFTGKIKIINARIVKAKIGEHEFRDSYAILPVPLATFGGKLEIDYRKLEPNVREKHRPEIIEYLKGDCVTLFDNIAAFCNEFSPDRPPKLTMASTAMAELNKVHKFQKMNLQEDEFIRPYFFGGRCQCFETGLLKGNFTVVDENSAYPKVMRDIKHPISNQYTTGNRVTKNTAFLTVEADNYGAFAQRMENNALSFRHGAGTFNVTIHEYNAALQTGTAKINKIVRTVDFKDWDTFDTFINHFYGKRLTAAEMQMLSHVIFYKLVMNGAYGKFAQNCADFMDYRLERELLFDPEWEIAYEGPNYFIYERPAKLRLFGYYNVATGASITGAARSALLLGLATATRPLYSDTDSIICESFPGASHSKELGAWKIEATGDLMAIAGKKTYALLSSDPQIIAETKAKIAAHKKTPDHLLTVGGVRYACVKKASKGVTLTAAEIVRVARGGVVEYPNPVPNFRLSGAHRFVTRRIRATA